MTNDTSFASQPMLNIPIQTSTFNAIPCYQRFQWLNSDVVSKALVKFLKPNEKGRKGYDKIWMFRWLIYKHLMSCSYRDLESMTGVDYSTFIKFRKRLIRNLWFPRIFKMLVDTVVSKRNSLSLLIDSSFVQTYSKHDEKGSEYSGFKKKTGFKLHSVIDYKTRLPVLQIATGGARPDIKLGRNLIRGAPKLWKKKVKLVAADKGYDADDLVFKIKKKFPLAKVAIPPRIMSKKASKLYKAFRESGRCMEKRENNKRTEIERYFSRKKRVFNLGEEQTRHLKNFRANCHMTSIMEILEWLSKNNHLVVLFTRLYLVKLTVVNLKQNNGLYQREKFLYDN